jgi:[ribosomal protein S5]-alanine N-acetyltransferase
MSLALQKASVVQERLDGEAVFLRPLGLDDVTANYLRWLNDLEVTRFLETRHPQTMQTVREFVERVNASNDQFLFGIFLKKDARHVGNIKIGPVKPHHLLADVTLLIGERDCWGQGIATDAIRTITRFGFEKLRLSKLTASMYAGNVGSIRAYQRAGFAQEGIRRKHYILAGEPTDVVELGLCADDLKS